MKSIVLLAGVMAVMAISSAQASLANTSCSAWQKTCRFFAAAEGEQYCGLAKK